MKKAFVLLAVLGFMLVVSANGGIFPWDYSDYNGQEGYNSEEVVESNTSSDVYADLILVSTLSGSAVCNGDGTMDVSLTFSSCGSVKCFYVVIIKNFNDEGWGEVYHISNRSSNSSSIGGRDSGNFTVTETELVSGDAISYRVIYYGFKSRLLAVSNIETFTYQ